MTQSTCIDCGSTVHVIARWPGYGHRYYPRCDGCGERRLEREAGNIARNFQTGPIGDDVGSFDSADAGESFGEDI